jgi:hypothetical protein
MNVQCRDMEELVACCLDREASPARERMLREHLAACETCRAAFEPLLEMIWQVEQAPAPRLPAGLYKRVLAEMPVVEVVQPVERVLPGRFVVRLSWLTAAAAALMLAVLWPGTHPIPGGDSRGSETAVVATPASVDAIAMACLTAMPYTTSSGAGGAMMALVGARLAQEQSQRMAAEPVRIAVCMATPAAMDEDTSLPISDVIQMISNRAAMHGGL